jgi:hypothetical protein
MIPTYGGNLPGEMLLDMVHERQRETMHWVRRLRLATAMHAAERTQTHTGETNAGRRTRFVPVVRRTRRGLGVAGDSSQSQHSEYEKRACEAGQ